MDIIGPIKVGEVKTARFDFSGDTTAALTVVSITVTVLDGTDPSPSTVKSGTPQVTGQYVYQKVQANGVVGARYKISCLVQGADAQRHLAEASLKVLPG